MFSKHGQSLKVLMMPTVSMTVSHLCRNVEIDVVSLFTKTPIQQTLTIIREGLEKDQDLKKRINLEVDDIMDFTEFVATTTYFSFRGQLFNQKFGTAMGSPVSPILANFFMEWLEQQAIATAPIDCKPKLWKIYVDDILEIIKRRKVEALTGHLNGIDEANSIKFTHESEKNSQMQFLDTLITRREDGSIKLLVYRKATHTDQYSTCRFNRIIHFSTNLLSYGRYWKGVTALSRKKKTVNKRKNT